MTANKFTDIDPKLSQESLEAISLFGFTTMTPVQSSTIPLFLQNKVMVMNKDDDGDDDDVDDDDDDDNDNHEHLNKTQPRLPIQAVLCPVGNDRAN